MPTPLKNGKTFHFLKKSIERGKYNYKRLQPKDPKKRKEYARPLECNCKPFRSLKRARDFQKEFVKPYPHIYEIKE